MVERRHPFTVFLSCNEINLIESSADWENVGKVAESYHTCRWPLQQAVLIYPETSSKIQFPCQFCSSNTLDLIVETCVLSPVRTHFKESAFIRKFPALETVKQNTFIWKGPALRDKCEEIKIYCFSFASMREGGWIDGTSTLQQQECGCSLELGCAALVWPFPWEQHRSFAHSWLLGFSWFPQQLPCLPVSSML